MPYPAVDATLRLSRAQPMLLPDRKPAFVEGFPAKWRLRHRRRKNPPAVLFVAPTNDWEKTQLLEFPLRSDRKRGIFVVAQIGTLAKRGEVGAVSGIPKLPRGQRPLSNAQDCRWWRKDSPAYQLSVAHTCKLGKDSFSNASMNKPVYAYF